MGSDVARGLFLGWHSTFCFERGAPSDETQGSAATTRWPRHLKLEASACVAAQQRDAYATAGTEFYNKNCFPPSACTISFLFLFFLCKFTIGAG